jgi:hypothetical protein
MQYYRLYNLSMDGAIQGAMSRSFDSDEQAIRHAEALLALHPGVEVWQTDRLVGRVDQGSHCVAA